VAEQRKRQIDSVNGLPYSSNDLKNMDQYSTNFKEYLQGHGKKKNTNLSSARNTLDYLDITSTVASGPVTRLYHGPSTAQSDLGLMSLPPVPIHGHEYTPAEVVSIVPSLDRKKRRKMLDYWHSVGLIPVKNGCL
jgi:hypothetical protein